MVDSFAGFSDLDGQTELFRIWSWLPLALLAFKVFIKKSMLFSWVVHCMGLVFFLLPISKLFLCSVFSVFVNHDVLWRFSFLVLSIWSFVSFLYLHGYLFLKFKEKSITLVSYITQVMLIYFWGYIDNINILDPHSPSGFYLYFDFGLSSCIYPFLHKCHTGLLHSFCFSPNLVFHSQVFHCFSLSLHPSESHFNPFHTRHSSPA